MAFYDFEEFLEACKNQKNKVVFSKTAIEDADEIFNLKTKKDLVDFIVNGLENLNFVNTKDWENNNDKTIDIKIDSYEFRTFGKLGYIAFGYNEKQDKWIVKSFHLSKNSNLVFAEIGVLLGVKNE